MDFNHFAGRLRELREAKGWTQNQLETASGIKTNTIARLERGEREPTWKTVVVLAAALGVDCTAFTKPPVTSTVNPGRGRPSKEKPESQEPKRPRGRPKKGES